MRIIVTGSIAYDYLMSFPGKFTEHFLPEHFSRVSLSFLVDTMDKRRGGCAPNIAYTLALLGERPVLMATAGQDFGEYRRWLEAAGVDTSLVQRGRRTSSRRRSSAAPTRRTTRSRRSTPGAMAHAAELSFRTAGPVDLVIISPNDPAAMTQYAEECRTLGIRYIFDPGQQCARMSGDELRRRHRRRAHRHLQRLRVRADPAEDRARRGRHPRARRAARRHARRARVDRHRARRRGSTCRP